jgi:tetratricopeptide (TPR) repeat protein
MALAHNNLGSALTRTNRSGEAIGHYRQAIALDASGVASHLNLALDQWNLGREDEAIRALSAAIRLNPSSAVLHTLLGRILELNNQPGEALDQLGVLHAVHVLPLGRFVGEEGA